MTSVNPLYTDEFKRAVVAAYKCDPRPVLIGRRFSLPHSTVTRWVTQLNGGNGKKLDAERLINASCEASYDQGNDTNDEPSNLSLVCDMAMYQRDSQTTKREPPAITIDDKQERNIDNESDIDKLMLLAEREYLTHIVKRENIDATSTKDAAVIFKTLAEVEIKRSAHKLMLDSAYRAAANENSGDSGELKPALLNWERVLKRLMTDGDAD